MIRIRIMQDRRSGMPPRRAARANDRREQCDAGQTCVWDHRRARLPARAGTHQFCFPL